MGLKFSNPKKILVFIFVGITCVVAQDDSNVSGDDPGWGTAKQKVLGRRGQIVLNNDGNARSDMTSLESITALNLDIGLGVFDAFFASLSMILVSEGISILEVKMSMKYTRICDTVLAIHLIRLEGICILYLMDVFGRPYLKIGDETFIIAALMAMRHPKSIVLSGALSALYVMTILSTGLGRIVPNLISRKHTNSAATVLYAFFGLRLLYIAWRSDSKVSSKKDMEEVEEKLEAGQGKTTVRRFFSRFCTPIFLESFILTFLAEWGDRSQIATIALATHKNALGVAVGASLGHTVCTSVAVVGGSMLASKISQRTVATVGGLLFLGFSLSSYFYPPL